MERLSDTFILQCAKEAGSSMALANRKRRQFLWFVSPLGMKMTIVYDQGTGVAFSDEYYKEFLGRIEYINHSPAVVGIE